MELLQTTSPALLCQSYFILTSAAVLALAVLPSSSRRLLLNYGARERLGKTAGQDGSNWLDKLVAQVTAWGQVPHAWFITFYMAYLAAASFWAAQVVTDGPILRAVASVQTKREGGTTSMAPSQIWLVWVLMFLQALRRLYEHLYVMRPSASSTMWFAHWMLGLVFYLVLSVSIWIEGASTLLERSRGGHVTGKEERYTQAKLVVGVAIFAAAWLKQYQCHQHLANLTKYSLPGGGLFRYIVCPHYTCECLLYFSLALVAAPEGYWWNRTLLCALIFVAINLGVTARMTRQWYIGKFGAEKLADRWTMLPLVF